jgi:hypothetical protein
MFLVCFVGGTAHTGLGDGALGQLTGVSNDNIRESGQQCIHPALGPAAKGTLRQSRIA